MDIILRESDRLNKIITNFLTYARPRAGNFSEVDVCEAVEDTVTLLHHSPDVKDFHKISTNLPDKPVIISADSTQLKQIFWNLARNALNAMPSGGELSIQCESISHNRIRITFSDTGCGMSSGQVEKLFEPFSESTTGGTGLGMSIVYQIVRDHGGTINVKSLENAGTTISVEVPADFRAVQIEDNEQSVTAENDIHTSHTPSRLEGFLNVQNK
jgi:two-component system sensor histidine kinase PilS (NtrC family)